MLDVEAVVTSDEVAQTRRAVQKVHVSDKVRSFIIDIVRKTRDHDLIELGASPRSSQHLQRAAQGRAIMEGRTFVIPEDVIDLAPSVLAHRLIMSAESKMSGTTSTEVVGRIVASCEVPVGIN